MEIESTGQPVTYIYALTDPRETDDVKGVRYIGKTKNPDRRFRSHLARSSRQTRTHCYNWIRQLCTVGFVPSLEILSTVSDLNASRVERETIARFRLLGAPLTNLTDGGDGLPGYKPSPETRTKLSAAHIGRKFSPETRAKIAAANKGNKSGLGHHLSEEARTKISAARLGKKLSLEHRMKLSASHMGNKNALGYRHPKEVRAKMMGNKNALGCYRSDETKRRMSVATRAYWAAKRNGGIRPGKT